jgi:hypothetical protein
MSYGARDKEDLMSFVITQPQALAAAAAHLREIGCAVAAQTEAASGPTTGVTPAAADDVSALTAARFAAYAQMYQAMNAQAAELRRLFVAGLAAGASSYEATEIRNVIAAG